MVSAAAVPPSSVDRVVVAGRGQHRRRPARVAHDRRVPDAVPREIEERRLSGRVLPHPPDELRRRAGRHRRDRDPAGSPAAVAGPSAADAHLGLPTTTITPGAYRHGVTPRRVSRRGPPRRMMGVDARVRAGP